MTDDVMGLEEQAEERDMTREEEGMATAIYAAVMASSRYSERALQAQSYQVGISDLGWCSERTRRMLAQMVPDDTDLLPAFLGTAIGDYVEAAIHEHLWPDALVQQEVSVRLTGHTRHYDVPGHPDIIRPDWGVLDVKTDRGLSIPRRVGPNFQQQFQRHCYTKGAHDAGLLTIPLEDAMVGNVWFDRAADDKFCYVQVEPYDPLMVEAAAMWLDEVVYAHLNDSEARKEPPREMCRVTCGFFETCRALDTDVTGLLTDETVLASVRMYREGLEMEKAGKRLKDQAKPHLAGIDGSTGAEAVRWIHVNESVIRPGVRKAHERLSITPLK